MSWALYLIGQDQEVQEKLQEELDEVFGDDYGRPFTVDDVKNLKYLECVLKVIDYMSRLHLMEF